MADLVEEFGEELELEAELEREAVEVGGWVADMRLGDKDWRIEDGGASKTERNHEREDSGAVLDDEWGDTDVYDPGELREVGRREVAKEIQGEVDVDLDQKLREFERRGAAFEERRPVAIEKPAQAGIETSLNGRGCQVVL